MDAGLAPRMMLEWLEEEPAFGIPCRVFTLAPAIVGREGKDAPIGTMLQYLLDEGRGPCTFHKRGLCELHDTPLKPFQCRTAYGCRDCQLTCPDNRTVGMLWHSDEGRAVIERWKKLVNYYPHPCLT